MLDHDVLLSCLFWFIVSYVERTRQHCWRCSEVTFHCPEQALCLLWVQTIREQLALLSMFLMTNSSN